MKNVSSAPDHVVTLARVYTLTYPHPVINTHTYSRHTAGVTLSHVELNESRQRLHVPDERAIWGSRVTARASRESEVVANGVQKRVFLPMLFKKKKTQPGLQKKSCMQLKYFLA